MPGHQPTTNDFPSNLQLTITPPPSLSTQPINALILLHGLGDTNASFTNLGKQLALPETTCISLQAPTPLPFDLGGYHWGDDIVFDQSTGQMELDAGFEKAGKMVEKDIIQDALIGNCGHNPRDIFLFGYRQGAMAAIVAMLSMNSLEEFGGIISIGGPVPTSSLKANQSSKTPICVLGGSTNTLITKSALDGIKKCFEDVRYHKWERPGDGMPRNRAEMYPIMRFLASRMRSRKGVPEGSVEIG